MKQFILNYTDGYHIKQIGYYQTLNEAQTVMRQQYREYQPNEWLKEFEEISEVNDTNARLYDNGSNVHVWSIATIDVPQTTYQSENNRLIVNLPDGQLIASVAQDSEFPGIGVEFIAKVDSDTTRSRPCVLIDHPCNDKLRCVIWNESIEPYIKATITSTNEDYTEEIF